MFIFLVCSLAGGALAVSVAIDGCDVSVTSMGAEYCIHCSDSNMLPTPDGTACALSCGTNEGIKDCVACGTGKCSKCATSGSSTLVPTSDGLKCVSKCNTSRSTGIEHCQTCTGILQQLQCTTCNSPYTPSSDKKSCVLLCSGVTVDNCQECDSGATTCKTCQPGYALSADRKFCYRTCGTSGPIQYCTGCREQVCTACNSLTYLKNNHCVLRRGLEEPCSADDPCHVSLRCLFSGLGLENGTKSAFQPPVLPRHLILECTLSVTVKGRAGTQVSIWKASPLQARVLAYQQTCLLAITAESVSIPLLHRAISQLGLVWQSRARTKAALRHLPASPVFHVT